MSKQTGKKRPLNLDGVRAVLVNLKSYRVKMDDLKDTLIPDTQVEAIAALRTVDPDGKGVVFDYDGEEIAAWVQQNDPSEFWDVETLIPWLRKNKARWMSSSTRVFDAQKFEAEVAAGNIDPKLVRKFKKSGSAPKPFVRFNKPKKDSLR